MKFTILIGRKSASYFDEDEKLRFNGQYDRINLVLNSLEIAHEIAKLAEIDCYRIMKLNEKYNDFSYSDTPIFETEDITAYWNKSKKDSEDYDALQNKRVKIINSWPEYTDHGNFGIEGLEVRMKRMKYSYNKAYSRKLQGYARVEIINDGKVRNKWFSPENYITRAGHVQLKKFKDSFTWETGIKKENLPENFDYKKFLVALRTIEKDFDSKVRSTMKS